MKSPLKTCSNDENLNISTKIYSTEAFDSKGSIVSPRSITGFNTTRGEFRSVSKFGSSNKQSKSKKEIQTKQRGRFEYLDTETHYKELIRITSVEKLPINNNYATISSDSQKYKVSSIFSPLKGSFSNISDPSPFRKYKRAYPPVNLEEYRPLVETDTNKLKNSINDYVLDGLEISEFKRILIKNNIDPKESKVEKIITELECSGPSGTISAVDRLKPLKDCKPIEIQIPKTFDQRLTSFENVKTLSMSRDNEDNSIITKVEKNINFSGSKRKNNEFKHHTDSSEFPLFQNTRTIKSIKVKDADTSNNKIYNLENSNSSKEKRINFMQSSTAFKVEKEPLDNSKLAKTYFKTIEENSKNKNLLVHNIKLLRSEESNDKLRNNSVKKYKNDYSEDNVLNTFGKTEREISKQIKTITSIKIVGLVGKAKAVNSNSEINQLSSTLDLNWKNPKTKNDFPSSKYGSFYDETHEIKNNKKSKVKMFDKSSEKINTVEISKVNDNSTKSEVKNENKYSFSRLKEMKDNKSTQNGNISNRPLISKLVKFGNDKKVSNNNNSFLSLLKKTKCNN